MKRSIRGFICCALFLGLCAAPSRAQQPAPPPAEQTPPETPAEPAAPTEPTKLPIPEMPKYTDVRMPGERGLMIGISGWSGKAKAGQFKGKAAAFDNLGNFDFETRRTIDRSAEIGIAAGLHNMLRFSYLEARGSGNGTAPTDLTLWTVAYNKGDYLATDYRVRSFKVAFDYLSWPYPVKSSRFRLKTLLSLQYTGVKTSFDAPLLPTVDSSGNPVTDSSGNIVNYRTTGREYFLLPGVGIGIQEYVSRRFSLEANVSGFAIPHHQNYWDADAAANIRVGHYEVRAGVRGYHFRTSAQHEFWMRGTVFGPFVGLRWHSDNVQ